MKRFLNTKWPLSLIVLIFIPSLTMAQAVYVGSKKCMSCHSSIYEMWKDTLHNKSQQVQSRTNDTLVVDWKGMLKLKAGNIPEVLVKLEEGPAGIRQATLVDGKDLSKEVTYDLCGGTGLTRLLSTFCVHQTEESRLADFDTSVPRTNEFYKDSRNVGLWTKKRMKQMGVDLGPKLDDFVEKGRTGKILDEYGK